MTVLEPEDVANGLEAGDTDFELIDIRPAEEYEEWHIPGSRNIDVYAELKADPTAEIEGFDDLPRGREIVTVCGAGELARTAADRLRAEGYDAKPLEAGMNGWARVHRYAQLQSTLDGALVQVTRPGTGCLSYILLSDGTAAVFDPSQYVDAYATILEEYNADLVAVFDTHAHADHVSGGRVLARRFGVPYHLHPADSTEGESTPVADGERHRIGRVDVGVIHTPGHSPGSVTYAIGNVALLTGDTLFHESVGRVELDVVAGVSRHTVRENAARLYDSLERLRKFGDDWLILPSHDPGSPLPPISATLAEVMDRNVAFSLDREASIAALTTNRPEQPANFRRIKRANVGKEVITDEDARRLELGPNRCAAE